MLQSQVIVSPIVKQKSEANNLVSDIALKVMGELELLDVEEVGSTYYVTNVCAGETFNLLKNKKNVWGLWNGPTRDDIKLMSAFNARLSGWVVPFSNQLYAMGYMEHLLHTEMPGIEPNARRYEVLLDGSELNESYLRRHFSMKPPAEKDEAVKTIGFWAGSGICDSYRAVVILYANLYAKYVLDSRKDVAVNTQDAANPVAGFNVVNICILSPEGVEDAEALFQELMKAVDIFGRHGIRLTIVDNMPDYLNAIDYHVSFSGADGFVCDPVATFLSHPMRPGYKLIATPRYELIGRKYIETHLGLLLEQWVVGGVSLHPGLVERFNSLNSLILDAIYNQPGTEA